MNLAKSNKRIIVSVVMALMMVMAMMPGMAFAQSVVAGYDVAIQDPGTILTGTRSQRGQLCILTGQAAIKVLRQSVFTKAILRLLQKEPQH